MSTALHTAILAGGSAQAVELALRQVGTSGCCHVDAASGEFPLHTAAKLGQSGTIKRLLRCGAGVDARTTNGMNATALHYAAAKGHADAVEVLLAAGASPLVKDARGRSAAYLAESAGFDDVAERLHDLRREAGEYQLADITHVAVKGLEGAAEGMRSFFSSLNPFASDDSEGSPASRGSRAPASQPPQPPAQRHHPQQVVQQAQGQQPESAPPAPSARSKLDRVGARVESVAKHVRTGHLKEALGWQDELTKAACELDSLDVGSDSSSRADRRALIARIDQISSVVDERLAATAQALTSCAQTVGEVEQRMQAQEPQQPGRPAPEWRDRLSQVAGRLDAIECATEAQRSERKALLARVDALETEVAS